MADTDKLVYLPQLQRYDEKLKRWVNDEFLAKADAAATDVRIDGKSITVDGVADIPAAVQGNGTYGVVKLAGNSNGLRINDIGELAIVDANHSVIDSRAAGSYPITTNGFDYAVKVAMCDGKGEAWTAEEQAAARSRMGIDNSGETRAIGTAMASGCTAYAWGNVVTVVCSGVSVPGNQKTQIGTLGAQYAPPVTATGLAMSMSSGSNRTGFLQVDTSGNVFINMITGQSQTEGATGVMTFLAG